MRIAEDDPRAHRDQACRPSKGGSRRSSRGSTRCRGPAWPARGRSTSGRRESGPRPVVDLRDRRRADRPARRAPDRRDTKMSSPRTSHARPGLPKAGQTVTRCSWDAPSITISPAVIAPRPMKLATSMWSGPMRHGARLVRRSTPSTRSMFVPMPSICAPSATRKRQRSWTCGSLAAFEITVSPARQHGGHHGVLGARDATSPRGRWARRRSSPPSHG